MRIIGGAWRGRPITAPRGAKTRPTTDMVREALFSALFDVEDLRVLDLFSGTGAVGLEALSRGAAHVTFVESGRPALAALEQNLARLAVPERQREIVRGPVARALPRLLEAGARFDLVFADPPYDLADEALALVLEAGRDLLEPDGDLVCEHRGKAPAPVALPGLVHRKTKRYGEAALSYFRLG